MEHHSDLDIANQKISKGEMASQSDKTEVAQFLQALGAEPGKNPVRDEHIMVTISAAGMDFFDADKFPNGLYNNAKDTEKNKQPVGSRRRLPGGGAPVSPP